MKRRISFGKVDYRKIGKKTCEVTVDLELKKCGGEPTFTIDPETKERIPTGEKTEEYEEFTASGEIWNNRKTDCYVGGQCLDTIAKYVKTPLFKEIHRLWKLYHLNGMNAGTPEQEAAIKAWEDAGNRYEYAAACEYLKSIGLYEVEYKGAPYKYGHAWIPAAIPEEDLKRIREIIATGTFCPET